MMSEEGGDLQPAMEAVTPEKGKGRRYSTGQTHSTGDRKKSVEPHYLRASTGSCHDLCKYGRRHEKEIKPWSSGHKRRIDRKPLEKIVTTDEVLPKRKNYLKAKPESSSVSKGHLPDSSSASKQKIPSSEKRTMGSNNVSKSKESSQLKSLATPGRLSHPARTVKARVSPDFEVSKPVSVKVAGRRISGKSASPSRTKNAIAGLTSFSKSPASSGLRSMDRKTVENTGISNRIKVKNAVIASTSSVPTRSSAGSARTSMKRKLWKQKTMISQSDQKIAKDHGIRRIVKEVPPEKILYVIDVESNDEVKNCNVNEINVVNELPESQNNVIILERPPSPSPSPSPLLSPSEAESSSKPNSSTILPLEEVKKGMENSCVQFSHHEEERDYADDDDEDEDEEEVVSEYSDGESEIFSDSESGETQNKEGESTSTADSGIRRRPREAVRVHPEGADYQPVKLKFRRGRVVEIQSDNNTPHRLKFRPHKTLGEDEARARPQRRVLKKREVATDPDNVADSNSEKYALRHSNVQEKKDGQGGLFNNVIEETASKLVETRKSKVKALVGAFETVISLQDGKPSVTNTG